MVRSSGFTPAPAVVRVLDLRRISPGELNALVRDSRFIAAYTAHHAEYMAGSKLREVPVPTRAQPLSRAEHNCTQAALRVARKKTPPGPPAVPAAPARVPVPVPVPVHVSVLVPAVSAPVPVPVHVPVPVSVPAAVPVPSAVVPATTPVERRRVTFAQDTVFEEKERPKSQRAPAPVPVVRVLARGQTLESTPRSSAPALAPHAPATKGTTAPRAPAAKDTTAPRAPATKDTTAPRAPATKDTTAPRAPATTDTTAPRAPPTEAIAQVAPEPALALTPALGYLCDKCGPVCLQCSEDNACGSCSLCPEIPYAHEIRVTCGGGGPYGCEICIPCANHDCYCEQYGYDSEPDYSSSDCES
jgi:hypothetical protein